MARGDTLKVSSCLQVKLTIRKHGQASTKDLTLVREKINFNPVSSRLCNGVSSSSAALSEAGAASSSGDGKVGYIRVATFSKQTPENTRIAIQKLKSEGADRSDPESCINSVGAPEENTWVHGNNLLGTCLRNPPWHDLDVQSL